MYMDRYLARIVSKLLKCAQFRRSKSYLAQGRYSSRPNQCWCFPRRRILKLDCLDLCSLDTTVHPSICACLRGLPKPHNEVEFDRIRMATCPIFASSGAKGVCPSGRRCRNRPRSLEPKCMACMEPDWSIHHSLLRSATLCYLHSKFYATLPGIAWIPEPSSHQPKLHSSQ